MGSLSLFFCWQRLSLFYNILLSIGHNAYYSVHIPPYWSKYLLFSAYWSQCPLFSKYYSVLVTIPIISVYYTVLVKMSIIQCILLSLSQYIFFSTNYLVLVTMPIIPCIVLSLCHNAYYWVHITKYRSQYLFSAYKLLGLGKKYPIFSANSSVLLTLPIIQCIILSVDYNTYYSVDDTPQTWGVRRAQYS